MKKKVRRPRDMKLTSSTDARLRVDYLLCAYVDLFCNLYKPTEIRRLAAWLVRAADWIEQERGKK